MPVLAPFPAGDVPRRRLRRLKSIAVLPTLFTLGNLLCGFAAIHFSLVATRYVDTTEGGALPPPLLERMLPTFLACGAGLIILGLVLDCLDGLVARATRTTTNFGGQLDSLADVVTFGVAPAILTIAFVMKELAREAILPSPISAHLLGRVAWICAGIYVALAAIRLARFNVEHAEVGFDHRVFRGLPSPAAAAVVAALIILQEALGQTPRQVIAYILPFVALVVAFLMVSRIPYRRFHRVYLLGRKPVYQVVVVLLVLAVFWTYKAPTLVAIVLWYAASGPIELLVRRLRGQSRAPAVAAPDADEATQRPAESG
ncbi:MAG TPA: CDP-alcohol phosphatidyltransferase family protein [Phycisphaerae bacterium]|nr:CDP-alcohol phosphatidyltransferase family protein [Phycisphaerae bacterium]HNU44697.1 CDP-alcohol phosphatidyltransferase family protein [Phycisphaerae bacterium]